ncbi:MAG: hypothetical protein CL823_06425 [Crocinitomicaceae bacterium]|nr:hypothetical protein [Crocinitomicaceae bacterium]
MLSIKNNLASHFFVKGYYFLFLLIVLKSGVVLAQAYEGEYKGVNYYARDSIVMQVQSELVTFHGDVQLTSADIKLTADMVVYNTKKSELCAYGTKDSLGNWIGRPVFTQNGSSFTQDEVCYNLRSSKGFSRHAVTQEGELVFHAGQSKRHPSNELHITNGKFTTCDADNPHYHFHLKKAIMMPYDKVVSGPLYMKFRKIPTPLALPFAWFPIKRDTRSHGILLPSYGDGGRLGFFLKDFGYYVPLGDHWDTRVMVDLYSGGSWAVKNISQYNYRYKSSGNFTLSYNRQMNSFEGLPDYSLLNNFFVRWDHLQDPKAKPNQTFSASLNFGSTGNFQNNLNSSLEDYLTNTFQSSVQWSYNSPRSPYSITTSALHSQNSLTGLVSMTLPSITINMSRRSVSDMVGLDRGRFKLLDDISVSYNTRFENLWEISDTALSALDLSKLDIENGFKHSVSTSLSRSFGFITVAPSFQYSEFTGFSQIEKNWYYDPEGLLVEESDTLGGFYADRDWNASISANTRIYGMFSFKEKRRVKAIRHVLMPSISASYTPERSRFRVQELGGEEFEWNPWEVNRFTPIDVRESGSVNYSLNQNLEAKVTDKVTGKVKKVKIIESITTSSGYNFLADSLQMADITTKGFTNLFNKVNLNVNMTQSAYARNESGEEISQYLVSQGEGLLRLKRATAAVGTSFNGGKDAGMPWNAKLDYTMNLGRIWNTDLLRDTTAITHGVAVNGGVNLFKKWKIDVQTGYDLVLREFTPTQLNVHWDLHCWELSFNWIPVGVRQSFALKLNIKSPLLKDIKIEARGSDGQFLF